MLKLTLFLLHPTRMLAALFFFTVSDFYLSAVPSNVQDSHTEQIFSPFNYLAKADSLQKLKLFPEAEKYLLIAQSIFQKRQQWEDYIQCYVLLSSLYRESGWLEKNRQCLNSAMEEGKKYLSEEHKNLGLIYRYQGETLIYEGQFDSAIKYINKSENIFSSNRKWEDFSWSKYLIGYIHYLLGNYEYMGCALKEGMSVAKGIPKSEENIDLFAGLHHLQGVYYQLKGNFNEALKESQKALFFYKELEDSLSVGSIYNNIGAIFFDKSDYEQAINYLNQSIAITEKTAGRNSIHSAEIYANIGLAYLYQKDFGEALQYFDKSLEITKNKKDYNSSYNTVVCYNNLSKTYYDLGKQDSSLYFAKKALAINQNTQTDLNITYEQMSAVYREQAKYKEALRLSQIALQISKEKLGERNPRVAINYKNLAEAYLGLNDMKTALSYCQKALRAVALKFEEEDVSFNPDIEDANDKNTFYEVLKLKGTILHQLFQKEKKDKRYLTDALSSFELAIEVIDNMRQDFQTEGSKHTLAANALPVYEKSIAVAIELSKLFDNQENDISTIETHYLKKAFSFAEKNKATILLEAIKEANALFFGNIPNEILTRENLLKRDMGFYERLLFEERQKSNEQPDTSKISLWSAKIFDLKADYQNLKDTLERFYPNYYNLKYDIEVASVEEIQEQLSEKEEILLEYFVGQRNVYVFVITANTIEVKSISNNEVLKKNLNTLMQSLKVNPFQTENKATSYAAYLSSAHWIYQNLVEKILPTNHSTDDIGQLIVIPDGILGYIPFEALLIESYEKSDKMNFGLQYLDYLIEDYSISYAYSSTLLLEGLATETKNRDDKEDYVGFAPVFEEQGKKMALRKNGSCLNSELQKLEASEWEVQQLGELMNGTVFLKEKATKENFIKNGGKGHILHLATHACLSEADPMFNTIHFVNNYLYTYELFNIRLDVDLAILSACNTGSGQLSPGEGIMSLSRGFLYSGCPSIVTSLWSVNDRAAAEIILNFHANLLEGQSKNDALRSAKLQYLDSEPNRFLAPYFWATFVHIGNPKPVEFNSYFSFWVWGIGISLCLILLSILAIKRKAKFTD